MNKISHKNNGSLLPHDEAEDPRRQIPSISFSSLFGVIEAVGKTGVSFDTNLFD